jgi:uncharacterized protein YcfL
MRKCFLVLPVIAMALVGCGSSDPEVTPDQEKVFRNPSKDIPPDIAEKMRKSREAGQNAIPKGGAPATTG